MSTAAIARALGRSRKTVRLVTSDEEAEQLRQIARAALQSHARYYVDKHLEATARAAELGNSKPAEWALERLQVVETGQLATAGLTIQIGVRLPGLGPDGERLSE